MQVTNKRMSMSSQNPVGFTLVKKLLKLNSKKPRSMSFYCQETVLILVLEFLTRQSITVSIFLEPLLLVARALTLSLELLRLIYSYQVTTTMYKKHCSQATQQHPSWSQNPKIVILHSSEQLSMVMLLFSQMKRREFSRRKDQRLFMKTKYCLKKLSLKLDLSSLSWCHSKKFSPLSQRRTIQ